MKNFKTAAFVFFLTYGQLFAQSTGKFAVGLGGLGAFGSVQGLRARAEVSLGRFYSKNLEIGLNGKYAIRKRPASTKVFNV